MKLNLSPRLRIAIYAFNMLGSPVMAYLLAIGVIGALEVTLWAAEMTAAFALAGLNVNTDEEKL